MVLFLSRTQAYKYVRGAPKHFRVSLEGRLGECEGAWQLVQPGRRLHWVQMCCSCQHPWLHSPQDAVCPHRLLRAERGLGKLSKQIFVFKKKRQIWVPTLTLPLSSCVTWDNALPFSGSQIYICKMGLIMPSVLASQVFFKEQI